MAHELFLISTKSGAYHEDLSRTIQSFFPQAEILETQHPDHLVEIVDEFSKRHQRDKYLYLLGGDGSFNEACEVLQGTDTTIGLIPYGTCNDFAKAIYARRFTLKEYLEEISHLRKFPIDLIAHDQGVSVNILSAGVDSKVLENAYGILKYFPWLKDIAYLLAAVYTIFRYKGIEIQWEGEGKKVKEVVKLVALCNGTSYGGGFIPAPDADPTDGILELCYVKDCSPLALIPKMIRYRKGSHLSDPSFCKIKTKKGSIRFQEIAIGNYDGTLFSTDAINYEVLPGKIQFAAPKSLLKDHLLR